MSGPKCVADVSLDVCVCVYSCFSMTEWLYQCFLCVNLIQATYTRILGHDIAMVLHLFYYIAHDKDSSVSFSVKEYMQYTMIWKFWENL